MINGGSNDIAGRDYGDELTVDAMDDILTRCEAGTRPILTLVPYQAIAEYHKQITSLNLAYGHIAATRRIEVVALNPLRVPAGCLIPQYTTDGVHLSDEVYDLWASRLATTISRGQRAVTP